MKHFHVEALLSPMKKSPSAAPGQLLLDTGGGRLLTRNDKKIQAHLLLYEVFFSFFFGGPSPERPLTQLRDCS